jgi:hypothetical protein
MKLAPVLGMRVGMQEPARACTGVAVALTVARRREARTETKEIILSFRCRCG